ncbi:hypothetical protein U3516DRAFT_752758 [Neocallimastix sp. 'constans']
MHTPLRNAPLGNAQTSGLLTPGNKFPSYNCSKTIKYLSSDASVIFLSKKLVLIKQGLINTIVIIHKNSFKDSLDGTIRINFNIDSNSYNENERRTFYTLDNKSFISEDAQKFVTPFSDDEFNITSKAIKNTTNFIDNINEMVKYHKTTSIVSISETNFDNVFNEI